MLVPLMAIILIHVSVDAIKKITVVFCWAFEKCIIVSLILLQDIFPESQNFVCILFTSSRLSGVAEVNCHQQVTSREDVLIN